MKDRTPQEKKALSYARDHRNIYGENAKASRRLIPLRKAGVNRSYRRSVDQVLKNVVVETDSADVLETAVRDLRRGDWKKFPDAPLGEVVRRNLEGRTSHAGNGKTALKRAREFVDGLTIEALKEADGRWLARAVEMNGVERRGDTERSAIERCKQLARASFLESLGAAEILEVRDEHISVETK